MMNITIGFGICVVIGILIMLSIKDNHHNNWDD
jgi:glycerol uptake facilitator-like aquaporin